jgi:hypothetical protein
MLTLVSEDWTSFFFDKHWWSRAWQAALKFAPACIPASVAVTIANLIAVYSSAVAPGEFTKLVNGLNGTVNPDMSGLLWIGFGSLAAVILVFVLATWALWQWLLKLTSFARAFTWQGKPLDRSVVIAAEEHTRQRRRYIMQLWLLASIYLLPPVFPLSVLIAVRALSTVAVVNYSELGLPAWVTSPHVQFGALVAGLFLTVVCMAYTFVSIVFSAISDLSPWRTATVALTQSLKHFVALSALTMLILAANIIVTAPQMLLGMITINSVPWAHSPFIEAGGLIWLGIVSPIVWPLSVAPFCQITKLIKSDSHE